MPFIATAVFASMSFKRAVNSSQSKAPDLLRMKDGEHSVWQEWFSCDEENENGTGGGGEWDGRGQFAIRKKRIEHTHKVIKGKLNPSMARRKEQGGEGKMINSFFILFKVQLIL